MIFSRRGITIDDYPGVKAHLSKYRSRLEPKPSGWEPSFEGEKWGGRKEGTYAWYELQDAIDYWADFDKPKIVYQVIQFYARYCLDTDGRLSNDKTFFLPTDDPWLLAVLNSPLMWWHNWRYLTHLKDEALSPMGYKMDVLPIATATPNSRARVSQAVTDLIARTRAVATSTDTILSWLRHEFELEKPGRALLAPTSLDAEGFVTLVRDALPKKRKLTAADIAELKREHAATIEPARQARAEIFALERKLSDLVNEAYGLTPEEVDLMWRTAPPRMPFTPTGLSTDAADRDNNGSEEDVDA
jgi:hypothetical protein